MTGIRLGPRMGEVLERVARANDGGTTVPKSFLLDSTASRQTRESQRHVIDRLFRLGLLKNLNGPEDPQTYFSKRGAALMITPEGRQVLGAGAGDVRAEGGG